MPVPGFHVCSNSVTHACPHAQTHVCTDARTHAQTHVCVHRCTQTRTRRHTCRHAPADTHRHALTLHLARNPNNSHSLAHAAFAPPGVWQVSVLTLVRYKGHTGVCVSAEQPFHMHSSGAWSEPVSLFLGRGQAAFKGSQLPLCPSWHPQCPPFQLLSCEQCCRQQACMPGSHSHIKHGSRVGAWPACLGYRAVRSAWDMLCEGTSSRLQGRVKPKCKQAHSMWFTPKPQQRNQAEQDAEETAAIQALFPARA